VNTPNERWQQWQQQPGKSTDCCCSNRSKARYHHKIPVPELSVTVSHGKLKNELRIRAIATNYDCPWTPRMISSTVGMLYRYALHRRAHRLPRRLFAISFVHSCPLPATIFAVGGTTVTFYRCEPLVRSRGIRAAAARSVFSLARTPTRARSGILLWVRSSDRSADDPQTPARFSERDLHGRSLDREEEEESFPRPSVWASASFFFSSERMIPERLYCGRHAWWVWCSFRFGSRLDFRGVTFGIKVNPEEQRMELAHREIAHSRCMMFVEERFRHESLNGDIVYHRVILVYFRKQRRVALRHLCSLPRVTAAVQEERIQERPSPSSGLTKLSRANSHQWHATTSRRGCARLGSILVSGNIDASPSVAGKLVSCRRSRGAGSRSRKSSYKEKQRSRFRSVMIHYPSYPSIHPWVPSISSDIYILPF